MRRRIAAVLCCLAAPALAQDDANLLANPGFEAGGREPDAWTIADPPRGVSIRRDERITLDSEGSLRLSKSANNYFPPAGATQSLGRDPGWRALEVGADVRARRVTKLVLDVKFAGGGENAHEWAVYIGAENESDPPADHDWTAYSGVVAVPEWATEVTVAVEIWGPGTAWVDNVFARPTERPEGAAAPGESAGDGATKTPASDSGRAITTEDITIGDDPNKRYFLHAPAEGADEKRNLLVVLPGGDGSAEFKPFVTSIASRALPDGYLVAQGVAPVWRDDPDRIVWPTDTLRDERMGFPTERFVEDIVADVRATHEIGSVFILAWSSSGPAAYTAVLDAGASIDGALVAMSVFKPEQLPPLGGAMGKAFYILHSPQDFIPMRFPEEARDRLGDAGAETTLATYEGGHGWKGDPFALIRTGIEWLEEHTR